MTRNSEKKNDSSPTQNKSRKSAIRAYIKYSAIAFQMIAIILLGLFGGRWLDKHFEMEFPLFLLLGTLIAMILAFYYLFKEILK